MKAKELVDILQRYNPDWTRSALWNIIDYVQRIMVEHPTQFSRVIGTDGGDPEFEETDLVDGVLTIADAFHIEKVYREGECPLDVTIQYNAITFPDTLPSFPIRVQYYKTSTRVLSDNIELDVPRSYQHLLELGCIARIEMQENGSPDAWRVWEQRELRRYWYEANKNRPKSNKKTYSNDYPYGER